jgi:hypothetical protein
MNIRSLSSIRMVAVAPMPRHAYGRGGRFFSPSRPATQRTGHFRSYTPDNPVNNWFPVPELRGRSRIPARPPLPEPDESWKSRWSDHTTMRWLNRDLPELHQKVADNATSSHRSTPGTITSHATPAYPFARMRCIESRSSALFLSKRTSAMFSIAHGKSSAA